MKKASPTMASLFSVAMVAMLLGAVATTAVHNPPAALALSLPAEADPQVSAEITLPNFREIARTTTPGVVNINTERTPRRRDRGNDQPREFGDDFLERFFGPQGNRPQTTLGTGFIIDHEGHILTNRHVVEGADEISVTIEGKTFEAELIGKDARTDVALLKIEPNGDTITPLTLGDSRRTEVGEWVMAIGNPFGLGGNSVTVGVVSYKGRPLGLGVRGTTIEMIQTDASINPGNSGGPLINTRGEVIGINTLIVTQGTRQSAGVGFAVPINVAKDILTQLHENGRVVRGWLGVQILAVDEQLARSYGMDEPHGAAIVDVTAGSPADVAGLQPDDVVVGVDGTTVEDNSALSRYVSSKPPETRVVLRVLRAGKERDVPVTLGTFPDQDFDQRAPADEGPSDELGMTLQDLTQRLSSELELPRGTRGAVVLGVEPGEAAAEAGLQRGDVILSVNGNPIDGVEAFTEQIDAIGSTGLARLRVRRGGDYLLVILDVS